MSGCEVVAAHCHQIHYCRHVWPIPTSDARSDGGLATVLSELLLFSERLSQVFHGGPDARSPMNSLAIRLSGFASNGSVCSIVFGAT